MRKHLVATLALALVVLAATAVPAFTADTGTITLTITAQAAVEPCIEIMGTSVGFGTLPFSTSTETGFAYGNVNPTFWNCGTAAEQILIEGDDATGSGGTWALAPGFSNCSGSPAPLNEYHLQYSVDPSGGGHENSVTKTKTTALGSAAPGSERTAHELVLKLITPCTGSDGAGETFTTSVVLTAELP